MARVAQAIAEPLPGPRAQANVGVPGLRRVDYVRIDLRHLTATAVGIGHRFPAEQPISLARAAGLAAHYPVVHRNGGHR